MRWLLYILLTIGAMLIWEPLGIAVGLFFVLFDIRKTVIENERRRYF